MIWIARQRHENIPLAGGTDIVRDILGTACYNNVVARKSLREVTQGYRLVHLKENGKSVPVKDRRLRNQQRRIERSGRNPLVMFRDSLRHRIERWTGSRPVAGQHVKRNLCVEDILWQFLERKQVHGLLMQFVHP